MNATAAEESIRSTEWFTSTTGLDKVLDTTPGGRQVRAQIVHVPELNQNMISRSDRQNK